MHLIDIIIGVPILWAVYKGLTKGLIVEISGLIALVIGIYGAIKLSEMVGLILEEQLNITSEYMPIIAWVTTFIVIVLLVNLIGKMVEKVVDMASLSFVNKLGGGLLRGLKVALIVSLLLGSLNSLDEKMRILPDDLHDKSMLYAPVSTLAPTILPMIQDNEWSKRIMKEAQELKEEVSS
jgi:membrane protein required for colicin V production